MLEKMVTGRLSEVFEIHLREVKNRRKEPVKGRKNRLLKLRQWIHANRARIHTAMYDDFRKPSMEVDAIELFHVLNEIKFALENLDRWTRPQKVDTPVTLLGTRSYIQYEPMGVCLIMSPWNYPFSLSIGPLVSALAAGNSVFLKPSELTPHVSALIKKMCEEIFEEKIVAAFEGGADVAQQLLKLPFNHIFFTGSQAVGKIVMKAAAENLTSITLELGGKSPAIVTSSAVIKVAAQRIAVAKFVNNGQTCVAPDYILVDKKISNAFIQELIKQTKILFTENGGSFEHSKSYGRIVNGKHFARLNELLQDALLKGAKLEFDGKVDENEKFFHPKIVSQVPVEARVLHEEIFGPILPVITYSSIDEAIETINKKPKALALYIFTNESRARKKILSETSAGGVCVNDCAIHFFHHNLPFGGVNSSGMGKTHGYYGFMAFSNGKPVLKQSNGFSSVRLFYPPYTSMKQRIMNWFLKLF